MRIGTAVQIILDGAQSITDIGKRETERVATTATKKLRSHDHGGRKDDSIALM